MAESAAEAAYQEVMEKMEELAGVQYEDWDDMLARQPGPLATGELGIVMEEEEND